MRVGFYIPGSEHLGIEYLSAMLQGAGHETFFFLDPGLFQDTLPHDSRPARWFNVEEIILDEIKAASLDALCFSVVTDNYGAALRMAGRIKEFSETVTIFGGVHCTSVPEKVALRPEVDYVIAGEGEHALVELCAALERGRFDEPIENLWYSRNGSVVSNPLRPVIADLDSLPFPDKDTWFGVAPISRRSQYVTSASRGCVYACTFCNNSMYKQLYNRRGLGRWQRRRSVANVIRELETEFAKRSHGHIAFWDEIFVDDREWLEEFCAIYPKKIGVPFWCFGYAKFVDDQVAHWLAQAGCGELNIGVQTIRDDTKRKYMRRGESREQIERTIRACHDNGIFVSTGNIFNAPHQSNEELLELAEFYNEERVDYPIIGFLRYYPKTEIVEIARNEGLLDDAAIAQIEDGAVSKPIYGDCRDDDIIQRRVRTLILCTPYLPRFIVRKMIERSWWKMLPAGRIIAYGLEIGLGLRGRIKGRKRIWVVTHPLWFPVEIFQGGVRKLRWGARRARLGLPKIRTTRT